MIYIIKRNRIKSYILYILVILIKRVLPTLYTRYINITSIISFIPKNTRYIYRIYYKYS